MEPKDYAVLPPPVTSLEIAGSKARFPVHRIYCVGRNYAEHAREMGHDPTREPPFFFMKPADALVTGNGDFPYPPGSSDVHHEIELVIAIGQAGAAISEAKALDHVFGYAVGLDMTRRDLQGAAKKLGRPWDAGKGFDFSAPCSALQPATKIGHPTRGRIWMEVNGVLKQQGDIADLIWSLPEVIAHLSRLFELRPGDLIYTGTPAGVGPVQRGEVMTGGVDGVGTITARVV